MARRKSRKSAGRRYYRKARRSRGGAKRPSLAATLTVGGAVITASGTVASLASGLQAGIMRFAGMLGISTGLGLIAAVNALKLACSLAPRNRIVIAYRAFLAGYGFRP